jgi:hypothetical protein
MDRNAAAAAAAEREALEAWVRRKACAAAAVAEGSALDRMGGYSWMYMSAYIMRVYRALSSSTAHLA